MVIKKIDVQTPDNDKYGYKLNNEGKIEIKSIKDASVFQKAKQCDVNSDGVLENAEIKEFLAWLKKTNHALNKRFETNDFKEYCLEKDAKGNISKLGYIFQEEFNNKPTTVQMVYDMNSNNEPKTCTLLYQNGYKIVMDFEKKTSTAIHKGKSVTKEISDKNYNNYSGLPEKLTGGQVKSLPKISMFTKIKDTIANWFSGN